MIPQGETGWIGSTRFTFDEPASGKIFYTLDGSEPDNRVSSSNLEWKEGYVQLTKTTTVRAVHYVSGLPSNIVTANFTRAKLPAPTARYGGNTSFYPSVICTLAVVRSGSNNGHTIKFTLDGTPPNAGSPVYVTPIPIDKSLILRAYAVEAGYDDSDPMQVSFTVPPPVAAPQATPASQSFSTNTLAIRLKSATPAVYFRYALDTIPKDWSKAAIVSGDSISIVGHTPGEVITLRTQAWKAGHPPSITTEMTYTYLPAVAAPVSSRPAGFFYDSATIKLSTTTPGASIRYVVTDNQVLGPNSLDGSKPIFIESSTRVRAYAFKSPQPQSANLDISYTLKLSAPTLDKQSQEFKDFLKVCITAKAPNASIYYSLDEDSPTVATGIQLSNGGCVEIGADTTDLRARAVKDGILGEIAFARYIKQAVIRKLPAPTVLPENREFEDKLNVYLGLEPGAAAQIRYTTNGTSPTLESRLFVEGSPIVLDSTTKLRSQAFPTSGNLEASSVREDVFVLNPSAPIDSPGAAMPFPNSVSVTLKCKSTKAEIRYWKGNTPPSLELSTLYDGTPLVFNATTRLQAVAVSNSGGMQRLSAIVDRTYQIYTTAPSDTLPFGSTHPVTGGFTFTNLSGSPVLAKTHTTSSLAGFRDASLAVLIEPTATGQAVKIIYSRPETTAVSLYRYANGKVEYITSDKLYTLTKGGEYFTGVDTLPPVVTFMSRDPRPDGATVLNLSVSDNIANPTFRIQSPGLAAGDTTGMPGDNGLVSVTLKASGTELKGLWYRASAGDFHNTGRLPQDPSGKSYLTQFWGDINTPAVWRLGANDAPWDMAGFPISASSPTLWGKIRSDNSDADLTAMAWDEDTDSSKPLDDNTVIKPGMAFWMSSAALRKSLVLSAFSTGETGADGFCRITLRPGWNQVASPLVDKVYWPITTSFSKNGGGPLKAPWRWVPDKRNYDQVDSLEPWVGYFAYYYGFQDTIITLHTDISKRLAKSGAAGAAGMMDAFGRSHGNADPARSVSIALDIGKPEPLYLGARSWAQDAMGAEDEPDLPVFQRALNAWSQRGKKRLVTDMVRFGDGAMHWSVVLDDPHREGGGASAKTGIKVMEGSLPAGYQAWAVSKARGMKFRLEPGVEMPWSGLAEDTLSIYAGSPVKLAGILELSRAVATVDAFGYGMERSAGGPVLRVSLPWNSDLQAEIWSISGQLLSQARPGRLNPGVYRLPMAGGSGSQTGLLRIRLRGVNGFQTYSQKIRW